MQRAANLIFGLLLASSAVYLSGDLLVHHDLLLLAVLSPAILSAAAYGTMLLLRVFRRPKDDIADSPPAP